MIFDLFAFGAILLYCIQQTFLESTDLLCIKNKYNKK